MHYFYYLIKRYKRNFKRNKKELSADVFSSMDEPQDHS